MPYDLVGFADEDSALRTVKAVQAFERQRLTQFTDGVSTERAFVRVTGAGTTTPAPPAFYSSVAGDVVVASRDGAAVNGYLTLYTDVRLLYPASSTAPAVNDVVEADLSWYDTNGKAVFVAKAQVGTPAGINWYHWSNNGYPDSPETNPPPIGVSSNYGVQGILHIKVVCGTPNETFRIFTYWTHNGEILTAEHPRVLLSTISSGIIELTYTLQLSALNLDVGTRYIGIQMNQTGPSAGFGTYIDCIDGSYTYYQ